MLSHLLLVMILALASEHGSSSLSLRAASFHDAAAESHLAIDPALRKTLADEFRRFDTDRDGRLELDDFLDFAASVKGLRSVAKGSPTRDRCGRYLHKVCDKVDELPRQDVKRGLLARMCMGCGHNVWSPLKDTVLDRGSPTVRDGGSADGESRSAGGETAAMAAQAANFRSKRLSTGWKIMPDGRKRYLTGAEYLKSLVVSNKS